MVSYNNESVNVNEVDHRDILFAHVISRDVESKGGLLTPATITSTTKWKEFSKEIVAKPDCDGAIEFTEKIYCPVCNKNFDLVICQARVLKITPKELEDPQLLKTIAKRSSDYNVGLYVMILIIPLCLLGVGSFLFFTAVLESLGHIFSSAISITLSIVVSAGLLIMIWS